jgi:hypothetical protein
MTTVNLEDSRKLEMRLYGAFNIRSFMAGSRLEVTQPIWLARSAKTYEDAQNLLFREEELEENWKGKD